MSQRRSLGLNPAERDPDPPSLCPVGSPCSFHCGLLDGQQTASAAAAFARVATPSLPMSASPALPGRSRAASSRSPETRLDDVLAHREPGARAARPFPLWALNSSKVITRSATAGSNSPVVTHIPSSRGICFTRVLRSAEEHDAVRAAAARGLAALATPNLLDELRRAALGGGPELRFACTRALLSLRQVDPHLRYTHVAVMRVTHAGHFVVAPEQGKPWPHQSNGARVGSFTIARRNGERQFELAP